MTINNARKLLDFILKHFNAKVSEKRYAECLWELASRFNINE